jgi:hypothetical protein
MVPAGEHQVVVEDYKDDVITISHEEPNIHGTVLVKELMEVFFAKSFLGGGRTWDGSPFPAISQLRPDGVVSRYFEPNALTPHFDPKTLSWQCAVPNSSLDQWVSHGVLVKQEVNRYSGCPECHKLVTTRKGCRSCMSSRLKAKMLIRHKACGYIGYGKQFDCWMCSCCGEKLVEGGYESMYTPAKCEDCGYLNDCLPFYIATCIGCGVTFPLSEAVEVPVYGYRKLDAPISFESIFANAG